LYYLIICYKIFGKQMEPNFSSAAGSLRTSAWRRTRGRENQNPDYKKLRNSRSWPINELILRSYINDQIDEGFKMLKQLQNRSTYFSHQALPEGDFGNNSRVQMPKRGGYPQLSLPLQRSSNSARCMAD
jgi:hypothetical protein